MLIRRTEHTAVSYSDTAQTYLVGGASILLCSAVTYQALAGMVNHDELEYGTTDVSDCLGLGVDYHPVASRIGAGGL